MVRLSAARLFDRVEVPFAPDVDHAVGERGRCEHRLVERIGADDFVRRAGAQHERAPVLAREQNLVAERDRGCGDPISNLRMRE